MLVNEYQKFARKGILPETTKREPIVGFALGLVGESGEVVDLIKKKIFHGRDIPIERFEEELGDVLWYIANIASECNLSLEQIIHANMEKLKVRYPDMYGG